MQNEDSGWREWSKYVLKELERLSAANEESNRRLAKIESNIEGLNIKAGVWGMIAGLIPVAIMIFFNLGK